MKKLILISIVFFSFSVAYGQTYHPLIESNTYWDVFYSNSQNPPCYVDNGYRYYFQGDTLISGHHYQVLHAYYFVSVDTILPPSYYCDPFAADTNQKYIAGFIREDSIAKKVYINYQNHDTLWYDFNLAAGDTLKTLGIKNVIDSVGTITLLNGALRNIFYLTDIFSGFIKLYYIESIGGSLGIISPLITSEFGQGGLVCVTKNNIQLWGQQCYGLLTGITEISKNALLTASPNPFSSSTTLQTSNKFKNATLTLYNSIGQQVKQLNNIYGQTITLHRDNLPSGLYFLRLTQVGRTFATNKLIIVDN